MTRYSIKQNMAESFESHSGLKIADVQAVKDCKIELCTIGKGSIIDQFNLNLLTIQGVNTKHVSLVTKRTGDITGLKPVFLFMFSDHGTAKRFYTAYVAKSSNKLPDLKPENVSVPPINAQNNRRKLTDIVQDDVSIDFSSVVEPEVKNDRIDVLEKAMTDLNAKFDQLLTLALAEKTSFNPFKSKK